MACNYIADEAHYHEVLVRSMAVKSILWIGTADLKDLYIKLQGTTQPFLALLAQLVQKGVSVRLIYAKKPGKAFLQDFKRYPSLANGLESMLCPRVHFKLMIFDGKFAYIGSANLTGAGIGMKSEGKRNFEAGIFTDEPTLVSQVQEHFDSVWRGSMCAACKRKEYCTTPIVP